MTKPQAQHPAPASLLAAMFFARLGYFILLRILQCDGNIWAMKFAWVPACSPRGKFICLHRGILCSPWCKFECELFLSLNSTRQAAQMSQSACPSSINLKMLNRPQASSPTINIVVKKLLQHRKQTTIYHSTSKQPFPSSQATSTMKRRVDQRKERCKIIAWLQIAWMQKANDRVRKMARGKWRKNTKEESSRSNWNHLEHPSWL